ncbi:Vacuolar protein sorting-associated protein [Actinidia chinensis var. chinensis]|uniref:Vacuolar protein sorting-associated protein n=1 Tax=Actinidia chinensis var. chinensis TaxID=1590841 RepID=A0A2R6RAZ1_ACTCC|nr:Vacuolar protein sorting-associated protein [Actinidia chinensis var. chinensis]
MLEKIGLPAKPSLRGNNWVVDATHCQGCSSQFTLINRKHHCRRCGGIFCSSCTQHRMVLRGQGDSPVRVCEPCKQLEEAARFEIRHGHKNRAGRGGSKLSSRHEDEVLSQILGSDRKESVSSRGWSTTNLGSRIQRDKSSASCSSIQEITTRDEREGPRNLSVDDSSQMLDDEGSASPEELRQQAVEEKKKYKILKAEGKSEEALKAFKRGKDLERQAGALELLLRKNRKRALSSSNSSEILKINDDGSHSGRKNKISPQKREEKDDLASELRELGWSDMDLRDADKKPNVSLEGELSTLLREVSQRTSTEKGSHGIDKTQVIAHKKKALMLKREGKLVEAKEELKRAKVLEKQLEEEELLAGGEDSDDELSALIRSIDSDKQEDLLVSNNPDAGFNFDHLMGISDDLGVNGTFDVTDEDIDDPEISAALKSLGWADEADHFEDVEPKFPPLDREAMLSEIQSLKKAALNQKRAGNTVAAMELLKKAKVLEKDLDNYVTQGSSVQSAENASKPNTRNINGMDKAGPKSAPKSRLVIQKELLVLKKRALALRREGKLDEADEELKKGKALEQQLEEIDNAPKVSATQASVGNKHADNFMVADLGDGEEDVTDRDMQDPTYLALLSNLGWNDEDDADVKIPSKPAKQNISPVKITDSSVTQAASSIQIGASKRSKGEIQKDLLGLKRKALTLRRQGETDEAEEVLKMAKVLETQLAEMELPKKVVEPETIKLVENETISFSRKSAVEGDEKGVSEENMQEPALLLVMKNLGWKDEGERTTMQEIFSEPIASVSVHPDPVVDLGNNDKITHDRREELVPRNKNYESDSVRASVSENDQSSVQQEILNLKRKALALKREGKLAEAREELRQAKLLEKSLEDDNSHSVTSSSHVSSSISNAPSVRQIEPGSSNVALKPLSSRDRFKLQQESLSHKRLALKLRREGRTEEAEAEFELAKALEAQLEESAANESAKSAKPVDDVGVEDFLDPQLLSALKAIGYENASPEEPEPVKSVAGKGANSCQERIQLEEQIKAEKVKAVNLKRSGKQAEALDALRRAKALEKKLNSLASW